MTEEIIEKPEEERIEEPEEALTLPEEPEDHRESR